MHALSRGRRGSAPLDGTLDALGGALQACVPRCARIRAVRHQPGRRARGVASRLGRGARRHRFRRLRDWRPRRRRGSGGDVRRTRRDGGRTPGGQAALSHGRRQTGRSGRCRRPRRRSVRLRAADALRAHSAGLHSLRHRQLAQCAPSRRSAAARRRLRLSGLSLLFARLSPSPGARRGARRYRTLLAMPKSGSPHRELTLLGRKATLPGSPDDAVLERAANPHPDTPYLIRFNAPEFTCLCPITGQPDFAHFVIDYVPAKHIVESKSLKLYLASFRNTGTFHEDCTIAIGKKIAAAIKQKILRIAGFWYPRGGIPIDVFWQTGKLPAGVSLPDPGVSPYRGR